MFEKYCIIVGQDFVLVLSIDDKAKIPVKIPAATKQVPMVMYMIYEIRLPDHNFLVAIPHKLPPSVYPACEITRCSIKSDFIISYSGPMHIVIRSGKNESGTDYMHGRDFDKVQKLKEFDTATKKDGQIKPIIITFVNEGHGKNPHFPKAIDLPNDHFKYFFINLF